MVFIPETGNVIFIKM